MWPDLREKRRKGRLMVDGDGWALAVSQLQSDVVENCEPGQAEQVRLDPGPISVNEDDSTDLGPMHPEHRLDLLDHVGRRHGWRIGQLSCQPFLCGHDETVAISVSKSSADCPISRGRPPAGADAEGRLSAPAARPRCSRWRRASGGASPATPCDSGAGALPGSGRRRFPP